MKKKRLNPNRITEAMVREAVKKKYTRWKDELKVNPNNHNLRQSFDVFKKVHYTKLVDAGLLKGTNHSPPPGEGSI